MLLSTMNDVPGREIDEVMGEVFGLTVRSRHAGSVIGAALKSLAGGELDEATRAGADAVLAVRFDASEIGSGWQEICAYGTAVRLAETPAG
jgi:uncharacterized protein YbjQ (UPF0145 family)